MFKCPLGTYCPTQSAQPTPCPDGTYGNGNQDNFDAESACEDCGRGLYSIAMYGNICMDCEPGYVCTGGTSAKYPTDRNADRGYECPLGHYCPRGTYEPEQCPVGTYSKYKGTRERDDCLLCKINTYNDIPGQKGCKQCGPTSETGWDGGATTCECIGAHRNFVKSLGVCYCAPGFKPKDQLPEGDSIFDCELIVKQACEIGFMDNGMGECIESTVESDKEKCGPSQCSSGEGTLLAGTGQCQCSEINDLASVCDDTCIATTPKVTLDKSGSA